MTELDIRICKELTVLLVEDEHLVRKMTCDFLTTIFKKVYLAEDGEMGFSIFKKERPDIVITDIKMPKMDGLTMAKELKQIQKNLPIIVTTAYTDPDLLIEAIEIGIDRFVKKPFETNFFKEAIYKCAFPLIQKKQIKNFSDNFSNSLKSRIGKSQKMESVILGIEQVANTNFSVILQGETGVGKTYIASIIHEISNRANKPFITVDLGSIPSSLIESELFGHKKGAFTDAHLDKIGYLEAADGGTVFFEELENMSKDSQAKLLRAVEEKKVYPLGSTTPVPIDVRIISATNIEIRKIIESGNFREDLYYRLFEFEIMIPPLRERVYEIRVFAERFFLKAIRELDKKIKYISDDAFEILEKNTWLGNIRELKNVIRQAVLLSKGEFITKEEIVSVINNFNIIEKTENDNIKDKLEMTSEPFPGLEELEKKHILDALNISNGKRMKAASLLKIDYNRFLRKIKKYDIKVK